MDGDDDNDLQGDDGDDLQVCGVDVGGESVEVGGDGEEDHLQIPQLQGCRTL